MNREWKYGRGFNEKIDSRISGRWRLLGDDELYDICADPLEKENVFRSNPTVVRKLKSARDAWWKKFHATANEIRPTALGPDGEVKLTACDVALAKLFISCGDRSFRSASPVGQSDCFAAFEFDLPAGQAVLHTAFDDAQKEPLFGAYYVYVRKVL